MTRTSLLLATALLAGAIPLRRAEPGFPYYDELGGRPYSVSYDARALRVDGQRALFLSGSLHYPRGEPAEWDVWLDAARANGLNMVEMYVFWNVHAPAEHGPGVWSGGANFTDFAWRAAKRGLFVYLRVGPYVCAEWTYGGIPLWLAQKGGVRFRETNAIWQEAMAAFFAEVLARVAADGLLAPQGGPVALVQVENELQPTDKSYVDWCGQMAADVLDAVGASSGVPLTMCNGETAESAVNTCNGEDCAHFLERHGQNGRVLVDQPGIWTENEGGFALWGGSSAGEPSYFWGRSPGGLARSVLRFFARGGSLMNYYMFGGGSNRRLWAGAGLTTAYATDVPLCHDGLPHSGKYHVLGLMHAALSRAAPALAAADAAAHAETLEFRAPSEAVSKGPTGDWIPMALDDAGGDDMVVGAPRRVSGGEWAAGEKEIHVGFRYDGFAFVENNGPDVVVLRWPGRPCAGEHHLGPRAAALVTLPAGCGPSNGGSGSGSDGAGGADIATYAPDTDADADASSQAHVARALAMDVSELAAYEVAQALFFSDRLVSGAPRPLAHRRVRAVEGVPPLRWRSWQEPIARPSAQPHVGGTGPAIHSDTPIEQGQVTRDRSAFASYTRYDTIFEGSCASSTGGETRSSAAPPAPPCVLEVDTGCAGALIVLVDGALVGQAWDSSHDPCNVTLNVTVDTSAIAAGAHALTLVSEHLGYANYGFRAPLHKGIIGAVRLGGRDVTRGPWTIRAGMDGERLRLWTLPGASAVSWNPVGPAGPDQPGELTWFTARFPTVHDVAKPGATSTLHLNLTGFARGHAWVNGHSLGRYWLLPRSTGPQRGTRPTQALYHIPSVWLRSANSSMLAGRRLRYDTMAEGENVVTLLEASGASGVDAASLYVAELAEGEEPGFGTSKWFNTVTDCEM